MTHKIIKKQLITAIMSPSTLANRILKVDDALASRYTINTAFFENNMNSEGGENTQDGSNDDSDDSTVLTVLDDEYDQEDDDFITDEVADREFEEANKDPEMRLTLREQYRQQHLLNKPDHNWYYYLFQMKVNKFVDLEAEAERQSASRRRKARRSNSRRPNQPQTRRFVPRFV